MTEFVLPLDLALRDRLRREAMQASTVHHPGLVSIQDVSLVQSGLSIVYAVPGDASPLTSDDVEALHRSGDPGAAIALLASIAAGLAHLHDAGLGHGDVALAHVWRRLDGSGVLGGWRPGGIAEVDVGDFAALADLLIPSGSVHSDIAQIVIAAADPDHDLRPSMARVAAVFDLARRSPLSTGLSSRQRGLPVSPPAQRVGQSNDALTMLRSRDESRSASPDWPTGGSGRHARTSPLSGTGLPVRQQVAPSCDETPRGNRPPWRWLVAAVGVVLLTVLGVGAVRASDAPAADQSQEGMTSSADGAVCPAATPLPRPRVSPSRSSGHST